MSSLPKVRCRPIESGDLDAVANLLARGFPARPRQYWANALERLATRAVPEGCPRFGYMLDAEGLPVGVLLLIFSRAGSGAAAPIRCNVSSWYVDPSYRTYGAALVSAAMKLKHVSYVNISAAQHTWPILKAQGYSRYSDGQFVAVPLLSRSVGRVRARRFAEDGPDRALPEYDLMRAHVEAGCVGIVCESEAGPAPFLFVRRRLEMAPFGVVQLVYCRDTDDLVRCAGALGRQLLLVGAICVICDSTAPIAGLAGRFFADKTPRYFRGPNPPRLNDLSFTELVLFGP
ncbi:MAG TPA: hypothetical protein VKU90_03045 [Caulobacteraceae bacterium]|nr:hypothetical protein [Caulobacteraceae bacterium]